MASPPYFGNTLLQDCQIIFSFKTFRTQNRQSLFSVDIKGSNIVF